MPGQTERENFSTPRFAFPRDARLHRPCEYQEIFQKGSKMVGRAFICYVHRQEGAGSKLGFAVSRKVGNAVVRNRVKRKLREFFRTHLPLFQCEARVVFVARSEAAGLSHQEMEMALEQLLKSGGVL